MEVSIKKGKGESRKGITPSRTYVGAVREEGREHKRTPPPHSKNLRQAFLSSTEVLHTIPTSGSRQAKRVPSKPVVTAVLKTSTSSGMRSECEEDMKELGCSSFLPQIRSKCSTLPTRKRKHCEESSKKQKIQVGNLMRRFERKFHNASLRICFKIFPEAHPHGIMINVLETKQKYFDVNGWPCARAWV